MSKPFFFSFSAFFSSSVATLFGFKLARAEIGVVGDEALVAIASTAVSLLASGSEEVLLVKLVAEEVGGRCASKALASEPQRYGSTTTRPPVVSLISFTSFSTSDFISRSPGDRVLSRAGRRGEEEAVGANKC